MSEVRFTQRARQDLLDIWLYVAANGSEKIADRIYDSVERSCARLQAHTRLGRARPEINPDARSLVIERWLAIYRLTEYGAQIVRIVDGARDFSALDWTPE